MVLGLSLTSDDVVWVLVDEADGTVIDHDVIEVHEDAEMAGAAARGAHAIATNGGFDVTGVRLTWSDVAAQDGLRLRTRLSACGFRTVEVVPYRCAVAVMVHPDTEPGSGRGADAAAVAVCSTGATEPDESSKPPRAATAAAPSSPTPMRVLERRRRAEACRATGAVIASLGSTLATAAP